MENTLENKAKFFALYYSQKRIKRIYLMGNICKYFNWIDSEFFSYPDPWIAELKPLSSISDEDAIDIYSIMIPTGKSTEKERIFYGRSFIKNYDTTNETLEFAQSYLDIQRAIDFLRSRGYALPWMGLSVEQLTEYGWIKLKEVKP